MAVSALAIVSTIAVAAQQPSRASDQQVQELLNRIDSGADTFRVDLDRAIDRSRLRGSRAADDISQSVNDLRQAASRLRDRANGRRWDAAAVEDILRPASAIDTFVMGNQLDATVQRDWQGLRRDLDDLARQSGVTWNRAGSRPTSAVTDQQVTPLLTRMTKDTVQFRRSLDQALRGRKNSNRDPDDINRYVTELTEATNHLNDRSDRRETVTNNLDDLLQRGVDIDSFMRRHPLTSRSQSDWLVVRRDLDGLAQLYNVAWDWSNPPSTATNAAAGSRFSGTYQLDSSRGDDPRAAAQQATRNVPPGQRERAYQRLMNRLEAPAVIAIDRNGNHVSMATSRGPRVSFEADDRVRTEEEATARINTRATFRGDQLVLTTTGNKKNDFTVTFEPMDAGNNLRVTRRIVDDDPRQPVTVASFYRKTSDQPDWAVYAAREGTRSNSTAADFAIPTGTRLVAALDGDLSTKTTRDRDRFSMTVSSPPQYSGAIIEGFVSDVNASGRVSGNADMVLNFQTITPRNGRTSQFGGAIESMRTPGGETVRVDAEGKVEPTDSQTGKTVQRGAIGAALGAIIGAIAGGGKGAGVGAVIGAGGGAGTVIAGGRDQLDLQRGTEVTITSGAAIQGANRE